MPIGFVQGNPRYTVQIPRSPTDNADLGIEQLLRDSLLGGVTRKFLLEMYGTTAGEMYGR
jgi:hypothetical protein